MIDPKMTEREHLTVPEMERGTRIADLARFNAEEARHLQLKSNVTSLYTVLSAIYEDAKTGAAFHSIPNNITLAPDVIPELVRRGFAPEGPVKDGSCQYRIWW